MVGIVFWRIGKRHSYDKITHGLRANSNYLTLRRHPYSTPLKGKGRVKMMVFENEMR